MDAIGAEERVGCFVARCRELGIRVTPQRIAVFRELSATSEHPAAETIYERARENMPSMSLDTVYRTLSMFESKGMVTNVTTVAGRARYDAMIEPHYHFVCRSCNSVKDVLPDDPGSFRVPKGAAQLGRVDSVSVQLHGCCRSCRRDEAAGV